MFFMTKSKKLMSTVKAWEREKACLSFTAYLKVTGTWGNVHIVVESLRAQMKARSL